MRDIRPPETWYAEVSFFRYRPIQTIIAGKIPKRTTAQKPPAKLNASKKDFWINLSQKQGGQQGKNN